jgi:hypothetical protein
VELIGEDESYEEETVVKWLADTLGVYVLSTTFNIRYIYYKSRKIWYKLLHCQMFLHTSYAFSGYFFCPIVLIFEEVVFLWNVEQL